MDDFIILTPKGATLAKQLDRVTLTARGKARAERIRLTKEDGARE